MNVAVSKIIGFSMLWWLLGNPFLAVIVLLLLIYIIDRQFIGLSPSMIKPLKRMNRISKLKQQLHTNPHDISAKQELARLLMERKNYREARHLLEPLQESMDHSAEYWDDLGTSYIHTGDPERGDAAIRTALAINPRVKYGEPYLRLAAMYSQSDKNKAIEVLQSFQHIQSSSCEAYYRLGLLYEQIGKQEEAKNAWEEAIHIYRALPRYKKRHERKWMMKCRFKRGIA